MIEGLTIFWLKDIGLEQNLNNKIIEFIIHQGFYILNRQFLNDSATKKLQNNINYSGYLSPDFLESSAILIVAFDIFPLPLTPSENEQFPQLDNGRILKAKQLNRYLNEPQITNNSKQLLYSTENSQQAWTILRLVFPEYFEKYCQTIEQFNQSFVTRYPVLKNLSVGLARRAKVELIEYKKKLAVKKTFRPGCERFLQRELFVMKELSKIRSEIPPLLDYDSSFIIYPYYEDTLQFTSSKNKKISLEIAKKSLEILYFFYELGYALIDFNPRNLIVDRTKGLKVIDFEFLYRYKNKPKSFPESYDIVGIPWDFQGDLPIRSLDNKKSKKIRTYNNDWQPYIGLDFNTILKEITNI